MSLDKDLFKIDGFEISFHEKSKRIINIKIKEEIIKKLIFPFHKFDISTLTARSFPFRSSEGAVLVFQYRSHVW